MNIGIIIGSFLGGVLPAVLWLEFWLRESMHREPRHLIIRTFITGMASIFIAGFLEQAVSITLVEYTTFSFLIWAIIEESLKYFSAHFIALRTRFCDDVIDPTIYLITSALGFAAAENILFLFDALSGGSINDGLVTISFRFIGATLLHIIASSIIGIAIGFTFYKSKKIINIAVIVGLILATALHTAFNSFIIEGQNNVIWVFGGIWISLIIVILILDKIKNIKRIECVKFTN